MIISTAKAAAGETDVPFSEVSEGQTVRMDSDGIEVITEVSVPQSQWVTSHLTDGVPMTHGLMLAGILFVIGLCGVMARRNFLFMLMSLEIMMNAAAFAFVSAGSRWGSADGQVMFVLILTLAAAEAAIGLAILLRFYHARRSLDVDNASEMRG